QPVFTLVTLYVVGCVIAYQYIEWRYHFTPELMTFLSSYLVKQISVVFLAIALLALVLAAGWKQGVRTEAAARITAWVRIGAKNLIAAGIIVILAVAVFFRLIPHRVNHITVKFLEQPASFNEYAFAYIVYEINRFQNDWHYTLDPDVFNRGSLASGDAERC